MADEVDRLQLFEQGGAIEVPVAAHRGRAGGAVAARRRGAAGADPERGDARLSVEPGGARAGRRRSSRAPSGSSTSCRSAFRRAPSSCASSPSGPDELRAWVEANWRRREGGGPASGSDEVTLLAAGAGDRAACRPWCARCSSPMRRRRCSGSAALPRGQRDGARAGASERSPDRRHAQAQPTSARWASCARSAPLEPELQLADLSWLGISPLRGMCAALFDPPRDPSVAATGSTACAWSRTSRARRRAALLALGWLLARLGWTGTRRLADGAGNAPLAGDAQGRQAGDARAGDRARAAATAWPRSSCTRGKRHLVAGARQPAFTCAGPTCRRARSRRAATRTPSCSPPALGSRGRDPVFRDALALRRRAGASVREPDAATRARRRLGLRRRPTRSRARRPTRFVAIVAGVLADARAGARGARRRLDAQGDVSPAGVAGVSRARRVAARRDLLWRRALRAARSSRLQLSDGARGAARSRAARRRSRASHRRRAAAGGGRGAVPAEAGASRRSAAPRSGAPRHGARRTHGVAVSRHAGAQGDARAGGAGLRRQARQLARDADGAGAVGGGARASSPPSASRRPRRWRRRFWDRAGAVPIQLVHAIDQRWIVDRAAAQKWRDRI